MKQDNENKDYEMKRERAQKIAFAKIRELMQRNVSKNSNKTFQQYTKDLIKQYLASPSSNLDTIREVSRFLMRNSMIYKKMVYYYATAPLFLYSLTQENVLSKKIDRNKSLKSYEEVLRRLNKFNMGKELPNIIATTIRDGIYVGFVYDNNEDGLFIMPLDVKYCRIYGKSSNGQWIVYFNAEYFNSGNNKEFVEGVNGDTSGTWDECFIKGYKQYKEYGKDFKWFRLSPEKTFCLFCGADDEFDMPLPLFTGLFISLLDLIDLEQILMSKTELENYILLISKIPLIENSEDVDDFALSLELVQEMQALIDQAVPDLVGTAYSPMDLETIKFDKSNSAEDTDMLSKSMNNLFSNAGISQIVVSGGSSTSQVGLKHAIENDMSTAWIFVNKIESLINSYIYENISQGYIFRFHQITWYNRDTYISNMKDMATLGGNAIDYFVCATGKTPYEVINDVRFNAMSLNINQWLVPLSSTYTQSSSSTSNDVGRPTKNEDDLTEEGAATRDGDKNGSEKE